MAACRAPPLGSITGIVVRVRTKKNGISFVVAMAVFALWAPALTDLGPERSACTCTACPARRRGLGLVHDDFISFSASRRGRPSKWVRPLVLVPG